VQIYPLHKHVDAVVAVVPKDLGHPRSCHYYLVESMGSMLIAVLHKISTESFNAFALFKVDLCRQELSRVTSLGDRTLFLSHDRCLSVSAKDLPSITSNCIYFAMPESCKPVTVHSLKDGSFESLSTSCHGNDKLTAMAPTFVKPYTLADHLLTYCHHREWTRGLMFHEFHFMPTFWTMLRKRIDVQDSEVTVPRLQGPVEQLKRPEIPDLLSFATSLGSNYGTRSRLTS
jgi:hypothetical protein